jgi:basic membrane protein A
MPQAKLFLAVLLAYCLAGFVLQAQAADAKFQPAIVYDMGGRFDKSFNESGWRGAERFKSEAGIPYREFEITNEGQRELTFVNMARRGATIIVAIGFTQRSAVASAAKQFPNVKFTIIDVALDMPNVQSIVYREHEGAYLMGMMAAMATRTGKIGFVGGMDIPIVRRYELGYEEGAHAVSPTLEVLQNMTGTTPAAWIDPTRGAELARSQFDRGVDVVFAAAGTTGLGIMQAAADQGKLSIGVDSNQNGLHPGSVLTSQLKRVDQAVYRAFNRARDGSWKPGVQSLGLAEGGVGYAMDENNEKLVTPAMLARVEAARLAIIAGTLKVTDYTAK